MAVKKHRLLSGKGLVLVAWLSVIGGSFPTPGALPLCAQGRVLTQDPSPILEAEPNPVPHGAGKGTTTIEWDVGGDSSGRIDVRENDAPPALFASGPRGSATADWITSGSTYEFRLFGDDPAVPLATVRVTRAEPNDRLVLIVGWMIVFGLGAAIALRAGLRARMVLIGLFLGATLIAAHLIFRTLPDLASMRTQDIYYAWLKGSRIIDGSNPYERIPPG